MCSQDRSAGFRLAMQIREAARENRCFCVVGDHRVAGRSAAEGDSPNSEGLGGYGARDLRPSLWRQPAAQSLATQRHGDAGAVRDLPHRGQSRPLYSEASFDELAIKAALARKPHASLGCTRKQGRVELLPPASHLEKVPPRRAIFHNRSRQFSRCRRNVLSKPPQSPPRSSPFSAGAAENGAAQFATCERAAQRQRSSPGRAETGLTRRGGGSGRAAPRARLSPACERQRRPSAF